MQTVRLLQAVVVMLVVALAASCTVSKEYTSKLFAPRNPEAPAVDTQAMALHFLDLDSVEPDQENWVSTDVIMGRDSSRSTTALDNFSRTFPAAPVRRDSTAVKEKEKDNEVKTSAPPILVESRPATNDQSTEPLARMYNPGEVRVKKSRDEK